MREQPETTGEGLVPSPTASTTGEELDLELEMEEDSPASSSMNDYQYPPDVKLGIEELCPVCGDKVSGYHYGLLTCESCKGFFKRTVQNKKVYSCVDNRTCHIDKSQRKRCPYCRFQKCLSVGMKLEAVRPDRMRGGRNKFGPMYKRDRAIKQQAVRQRQQLLAQYQIQLSNAGMTSLPNVDIHGELKPNMGMYGSAPPPQGGVGPPGGMISGSPMRPMLPLPPRDNHQCMSPSPVGMTLESSQGSYIPPPCTQSYTVPSMMADLPPHHHPQQHHHHPHHEQQLHHHSHLHPHSVAPHRTLPTPPIVPPLIKHLQANEPSEEEVQHKLASFVESEVVSICHQRGLMGQHEFGREFLHLVCKLCDQCLFLLVEWARGAHFFKDLKVEDQMKLLQNCWSELLILNFVYRQASHHKYDEIVLGSGQVVSMDVLNEIGLGDCRDRLVYLVKKFQDLKVDHHEYTCMKFAILLNPDVAGVQERHRVEMSQEKVNSALIEYCSAFYPDVNDRFGQLLLRLPEIRAISVRAEEYLYYRHLSGDIPEQTLLMEMLHSKRR